MEELKENEGVERQPEFESIAFKAGWMTLYCSNESTAEWVKLNFVGIKNKTGLKIALWLPSVFISCVIEPNYTRDTGSNGSNY